MREAWRKMRAVPGWTCTFPLQPAAAPGGLKGPGHPPAWRLVWLFLLLLVVYLPLPADITLRHQFRPGDGILPTNGQLVYSSTTTYWYGLTVKGGDYDQGTLFRLKDDGSEYQILHHFGAPGDGAYPAGSLRRDGEVFFGLTSAGGTNNCGTIFKINTGGDAYALLYSFTGTSEGGDHPVGRLTVREGVLYGMTQFGGFQNHGTIFKINMDGQGFSLIYNSFGVEGSGTQPTGSLLMYGDWFYGTTKEGGILNYGTVFRIKYDGQDFFAIHHFTGLANDGKYPNGDLVYHVTYQHFLIGTTAYGGAGDQGTVFKLTVGGGLFSLLHSFTAGPNDGEHPLGALYRDGLTLYGTTLSGGTNGLGTVYKTDFETAAFSLLKSFAGGPGEGDSPNGSLTLRDGMLYGMTPGGGLASNGTVFKLNSTGGGDSVLHHFTSDMGRKPRGDLTAYGSALYGMTPDGGSHGLGTVFKVNPGGSGYTVLHHFAGLPGDGTHPYGSLLEYGGALFGMTREGGTGNAGTIFMINPGGGGYKILRSFAATGEGGNKPYGSLTKLGLALYGMTGEGGANSAGTIFKIDPDGSNFATLHDFGGFSGDGKSPEGSLLAAGGLLYGMTARGGLHRYGMIFKITPAGDYTPLYSFDPAAGAGVNPGGSLIEYEGVLYGMTVSTDDDIAQSPQHGFIFRVDPDGANFAVLHDFAVNPQVDGSNPYGSLIVNGRMLCGMACERGSQWFGTVFKLNLDGSNFTIMHSFAGAPGDGRNPYGSLLVYGEALYGMTSRGGAADYGTVFSLPFPVYSVIFAPGPGGTLSGPASQQVAGGGNTAPMTAVPAPGYIFIDWTGTGGFSSTTNPLTVTGVTAAMAITANFALSPFTVTAPDGGESWGSGSIRNITWTSIGAIANVKIEYSTGNGSTWTTVSAATPNDGIHPWTVPDTPSTTCRVRISDAANPAIHDLSNATFTITAPRLTVTAPDGGEVWQAGSSHAITWTSAGTISNVKIEYSVNSGISYIPVIASTPDDGTHAWMVPDTPSTTCLVRISDAVNFATNDASNNLFTIRGIPPPEREVEIVDAAIPAGQAGNLAIQLQAQGDENALRFTITFNPALLTYVSARAGGGAAGTVLTINDSEKTAGRVGFNLALVAGQTFPEGGRELVVVRVSVPAGVTAAVIPVTFGDQPVNRQVKDGSANLLAVAWTGGLVLQKANFTIGGMLGVGVQNPERALHLAGANSVFRMDRSEPGTASCFIMNRTDAIGSLLKGFLAGTEASRAGQGQFVIKDTEASGSGGTNRMAIENDGQINFSGGVQAKGYITTSTERLKENIGPIEDAPEKLGLLQGVRFRWRTEDNPVEAAAAGTPDTGFIAEEVLPVVPEAVQAGPVAGSPGVVYGKLMTLALEALKRQQQQLDIIARQRDAIRKQLEQLEPGKR